MSRPISEVEATLRLSLAAPEMKVAIEIALPRIRERCEQLNALSLVTDSEDARNLANDWWCIVLVMEHALRKATDRPKSQDLRRVK